MTSINIHGAVLQLKIQKTRQYEQSSMTYHFFIFILLKKKKKKISLVEE
jgi:hypothetical protein